mmetsp:Transcript_42611/g.83566  ORF Transcript_42611/g.83566 Transcript_42611/m.83566 type:complete len:221 (-) Transcript_42611:263-925(-)
MQKFGSSPAVVRSDKHHHRQTGESRVFANVPECGLADGRGGDQQHMKLLSPSMRREHTFVGSGITGISELIPDFLEETAGLQAVRHVFVHHQQLQLQAKHLRLKFPLGLIPVYPPLLKRFELPGDDRLFAAVDLLQRFLLRLFLLFVQASEMDQLSLFADVPRLHFQSQQEAVEDVLVVGGVGDVGAVDDCRDMVHAQLCRFSVVVVVLVRLWVQLWKCF